MEIEIVYEASPRVGDRAAEVRVDGGPMQWAEWRGDELIWLDEYAPKRDARSEIAAPNIVVKGEGTRADEGKRMTLVGENLWDPDAPGHDSRGFPQVRNSAERADFYAKKAHKEGREVHIDPDGGMPHGEELRTELQRNRAEEARDRKAKAKERVAALQREARARQRKAK